MVLIVPVSCAFRQKGPLLLFWVVISVIASCQWTFSALLKTQLLQRVALLNMTRQLAHFLGLSHSRLLQGGCVGSAAFTESCIPQT